MANVSHRLSDIDWPKMRAVCAVCGPVEIHNVGGKTFCANRLEERRAYHRKYNRDIPLKKVGGVAGLLERSNYACECCGKPLAPESLRVDHDHTCCPGPVVNSCGECIRGALCPSCNSGIGLLGDTVEGLQQALTYLARWEFLKQPITIQIVQEGIA